MRLSLLACLVLVFLVAAPALAAAGGSTSTSTSVLAAKKVCRASPLEDLSARNIACRTAKRVYAKSLDAAREQNRTVTVLRHAGLRWKCRAYNPHHRNGNPAYYEWKCRAGGERLVHYRWLSGE